LLSKDDPTIEQIERWVVYQRGKASVWQGWPENIWSKAYTDNNTQYDGIVSYIYNQFCITLDTVEYYYCMPFLLNDVDPEKLFVPFRQSPQYQRHVLGLSKAAISVKSPLLQKNKWRVPSKFKKFGR